MIPIYCSIVRKLYSLHCVLFNECSQIYIYIFKRVFPVYISEVTTHDQTKAVRKANVRSRSCFSLSFPRCGSDCECWPSEGWLFPVKLSSTLSVLQILIHVGFLTEESGDVFSPKVLKGGPLGEMVQWADILTALHVLGHNLKISMSVKELQGWVPLAGRGSGLQHDSLLEVSCCWSQ